MYNRENKQHFLFFFQPIKLIKFETTSPRSWLQLLAVSSLHVISKLFSGSKTQELNNEKIQTFFFRRPQIKVGVSSFSKKKMPFNVATDIVLHDTLDFSRTLSKRYQNFCRISSSDLPQPRRVGENLEHGKFELGREFRSCF